MSKCRRSARLAVDRFIEDHGGIDGCVKHLRVSRSSVYGWLKRGNIPTKVLLRAVRNRPALNLNTYIIISETYDLPPNDLPSGSGTGAG